jgi:hypothetical protein
LWYPSTPTATHRLCRRFADRASSNDLSRLTSTRERMVNSFAIVDSRSFGRSTHG